MARLLPPQNEAHRHSQKPVSSEQKAFQRQGARNMPGCDVIFCRFLIVLDLKKKGRIRKDAPFLMMA
jgi:hypothetical protein